MAPTTTLRRVMRSPGPRERTALIGSLPPVGNRPGPEKAHGREILEQCRRLPAVVAEFAVHPNSRDLVLGAVREFDPAELLNGFLINFPRNQQRPKLGAAMRLAP